MHGSAMLWCGLIQMRKSSSGFRGAHLSSEDICLQVLGDCINCTSASRSAASSDVYLPGTSTDAVQPARQRQLHSLCRSQQLPQPRRDLQYRPSHWVFLEWRSAAPTQPASQSTSANSVVLRYMHT